MAIAVRRAYACPICRESFTKWGLCLSHIRASAPCREALGEKLRDPDALQELCRSSAGTCAAAEQPTVVVPATNGSIGSTAVPPTPALVASREAPSPCVTSAASAHVFTVACPVPPSERAHARDHSSLDRAVIRKLNRACKAGYLSEKECSEPLEELKDKSSAVQLATIDKFFSPGLGNFRGIADKGAWLQCCLRFCVRTHSAELPEGISSPNAGLVSGELVSALACQALLPDALSQECWKKFAELVPQLQQSVVAAVRSSLLANVSITMSSKPSDLSEHFMNIIDNEHTIMSLDEGPVPRVEVDIPPLEFEAIDGTLYKKLFQLLTFGYRSEEKLLKALADSDMLHHKPGDTGTLLFYHEATVEARRAGSAEVLSILHAAAAKGLVRVCARFIAEGLDVNEKAGIQEVTPLHLASSHGEVEVVKLLLKQTADPNARDGQDHSPLYRLVEAAAQLGQPGDSCVSSSPPNHAPKTHHSLLREAGFELLRMGAQNVPEGSSTDSSEQHSPEKLAQLERLHELRNMMRLHGRLRKLGQKFLLAYEHFDELCKMQFETASFVAYVFENKVHLSNADAAPTELRAFIESEFIQERDKLQRYANRLARRLNLSKKACDALVALPPAAGVHALRTWRIEEVIPHVYDVPDHLNAPPPPPQQPPPPPPPTLEVSGNELGVLEDAGDDEAKAEQEQPKLQGRVRKWDSERGFGFIVQDPRPGEDADKDIFVHRKNIVGSTPANHLDLKENCRISYRLGEQDGRPRALDATMIDSNGNILPVHFPGLPENAGARSEFKLDSTLEDDSDEEEVSRKFLRHLRSHGVQEVAREKRPEGESFLRCLGLKKHNPGRRDEAIWKKEIDRRVDIFLSWNTTPLQKRDFDFRVRRFLHEVCVHSSVSKVSEALAMVEGSTAGKRRDEIRSWPAYLATLLRRYDSKLYEQLAERDRRSRIEQRRARMEATASELGESIKGESTFASGVESVAGDKADSVVGDCIGTMYEEEEGVDVTGSLCEGNASSSGEDSAAGIGAQAHASSASSARSTPRQGSPEPSSQQSIDNPPPTPGAQQPLPPSLQPRGNQSPSADVTHPAKGLFAAAIRAAGALPSGSAPQPRRTFQ